MQLDPLIRTLFNPKTLFTRSLLPIRFARGVAELSPARRRQKGLIGVAGVVQ